MKGYSQVISFISKSFQAYRMNPRFTWGTYVNLVQLRPFVPFNSLLHSLVSFVTTRTTLSE